MYQLLLYAVAAFLTALFSTPELYWNFDSSSFASLHELADRIFTFSFQGALFRQWALMMCVYGAGLFLPKLARTLLLTIFLAAVGLFSFFNSYLVFRYSCPAAEMVVILNSADVQEVREYFSAMFINNPLFLVCGGLLLFALPAAFGFLLHRLPAPGHRRVIAGGTAGFVLLFYLFPPYSYDFTFWRDLPAVDFLYRLSEKDFFLRSAGEIVTQHNLPAGSKQVLADREKVFGLFVLGESDNRWHHSLYGYEKATDRRMKEARGREGFFLFEDVISATTSTQHTIYFMFTDGLVAKKYEPLNFGLCEWFRSAGATVHWLSNQRAHGAWSSTAALLFAKADERIFYSDGTENTYDRIALLPHVMERVQKTPAPALVCAHLMGSHYEQRYRIDPEWAERNRGVLNGLDMYDRTLVYVDDILGDLKAEIDGRTDPAFLLYAADHSETVPSNRSLRTAEAVYYEIPMFLYCNEAYRKAFPEKMTFLRQMEKQPWQTDRMIYLLANLMNFPDDHVPAVTTRDPRLVGFGETPYKKSRK